MDYKEKLNSLRGNIDSIDKEMVSLFNKRMLVSEEIADVKEQGNIPVMDEGREQKVIESATKDAKTENVSEITTFMRTLMALSRIKQQKILGLAEQLYFPESATPKNDDVTMAFQGVAGAWGEQAAHQIMPSATKINFDYFDDVFEAVKSGKADFGVLPIENSQTGAIGEVYDLLKRHGCYICSQTWVTVAQCLLGTKDANVNSVREVFSHPEGFNQCRKYLKNMNWDLTPQRNTAVAAQLVAEKDSARFASIGSRRAAEVHGLSVLVPDIMDNAENKTRFIAISAAPIYDETCNITSITFSTTNKSGSLCAVLQAFMLAGISLSRIESRPVSADRYRFFVDLSGCVLDEIMQSTLKLAAAHCSYFEVLGCYKSKP